MGGAARPIELVAQPIDFSLQVIALVAVAIAVLIGALVLPAQPLDFPLLPLDFRDQLVARRRAPSRLHAPVMARLRTKYKGVLTDRSGRRTTSVR
jgi:hypothetical protein